MGIKDWFGGDKKKAEFREEAKKLATGPLTPKTAAQLEKLRADHGIEDAGDDKTMLRREIYNTAAKDAQSRGKLTAGEAAELAKIQKFLALRDDQVERTKQNLSKLRILTEIRQGRLPLVPKEHAALRQLQFQSGEIAHYAVQVEMLDRPTTSGRDGVAVKWGRPYVANSAKVQAMPLDGARSQGEGYLILTNQRLIFKSGLKPAAIAYSPQAEIHLYAEGIRLQRTVGNTLLVFKSQSAEDTAEIVGELLGTLMRDSAD
jgi:hypothetical protein